MGRHPVSHWRSRWARLHSRDGRAPCGDRLGRFGSSVAGRRKGGESAKARGQLERLFRKERSNRCGRGRVGRTTAPSNGRTRDSRGVRWHSAASPPHLAGSGMAVGPPCSIVANLLFPVRCVAGLLRAARGPGKSQKPDRVENPLLGALLGSASRRRVQCA